MVTEDTPVDSDAILKRINRVMFAHYGSCIAVAMLQTGILFLPRDVAISMVPSFTVLYCGIWLFWGIRQVRPIARRLPIPLSPGEVFRQSYPYTLTRGRWYLLAMWFNAIPFCGIMVHVYIYILA